MTEAEKKIYAKVLDRMRTLCSRREYCVSDIRKKALTAFSKVLSDDTADAETLTQSVIESLLSDKYLDESRYAASYARDKSTLSGWGKRKICMMLSAKGVDRDTIAEALEEIDPEKSFTKLEKLLSAKLRSLKEDPQKKLKLIRFALSRGYSYDEIRIVVDSLFSA